MDVTKEISGKMSDNEEDSAEDRLMKVEALKAEKRKLKGEKELITVNVANDQEVRFPSMTFNIRLEC